MDAAFALATIALMLALGTIAVVLLARIFRTIRDLRGVTTGLHDTLRWTIGQVAADESEPRTSACRPTR